MVTRKGFSPVYSLQGRRGRCARKIKRGLVGDVLTIIHRWSVGSGQVSTHRSDTIAFGSAFELHDNVSRVSRRHASDVDVWQCVV